ncbi:MAG: aromatic ring-hydroxylating dioxygenase subunit alpha, partial [Gammaproteobacteria bacterium]|nr:aromatic ring-hydroxylating dioxygenase subunit alpha [Gammaproteobacteria bacterium]
PESHVFVFKGYQRANWLQATEGEIDPSHLSYLHRYLVDEIDPDQSYGLDQLLGTADDTDLTLTEILRNSPNPRLEIEETDFGVRIFALREAGEKTHVRVTNYVFPNAALVALGEWGVVQQHVPIDDGSNWRFDIYYSFGAPIDKTTLMREKLNTYSLPDYMPKRNMSNRYQFSAEEQKNSTYAGVGYDFNIHDTMIVEGAGPIQDRTTEHLGNGDKAIIAARQMLLAAARADSPDRLPITTRDSARNRFDHLATVDTVTSPDEWRTGWVPRHMAARATSTWAAELDDGKLKEMAGAAAKL